MNLKGNNDQFGFAGTHEYSIVYSKRKDMISLGYLPIEEQEFDLWEKDEHGYFKKGANLKATGTNAPRYKRPNLYFPIYIDKNNKVNIIRTSKEDIEIYPITDGKEMSWRWSKEKFKKENFNLIVNNIDGNYSIYKKTRAIDGIPSKKPKSIFYKPEYSSGNGTNRIKGIFTDRIFSNPKPINLLQDFVRIGIESSDKEIILDLFSGSGTLEDSIFSLYEERNLNFIAIQIPEKFTLENQAFKAGYKNICEIGKERIRRVGEKIKEENKDKEGIEDLDIGFKVFKLDSSNINKWDPKYSEDLEKTLIYNVNNIKIDRTEEDILYEVLLKYGIDLNAPIKEHKIAGKIVYDIGFGAILVCLENDVTLDVVEEIGKLKEELDIECCRVVFIDSGFKDDVVKTNAIQVLKRYGIEDVKSI